MYRFLNTVWHFSTLVLESVLQRDYAEHAPHLVALGGEQLFAAPKASVSASSSKSVKSVEGKSAHEAVEERVPEPSLCVLNTSVDTEMLAQLLHTTKVCAAGFYQWSLANQS